MAFVAAPLPPLAPASHSPYAFACPRVGASASAFTRAHGRPTRPLAAHRAARRAAALPPQAPRMLVLDAGGVVEMDEILKSADGSLVVVDYSTSWCGPCKIVAPYFEELSEKYEDVVFVKVMGDASSETSELMKREGIRAVPAFHFWKSSERVKEITGSHKEEIETYIIENK